jgi:GNAT superfamily N-acetyltransferase
VTTVSVRAATQDDAGSIAVLMTQLGYSSTPLQMHPRLARILSHPEYGVIVAEISRDVVGVVILHAEWGLEYDSSYGRVMGLVIDERRRGEGLGTLLMQHAERWCAERGADRVVLTSATRRTAAHGFYKAIGYEETGVRFAKRL